MFFEIKMTRNVRLHPRHFGPKLEDELMKTLMKEVAGNCTKRFGYVIAVTHIEPRGLKGKGVVQEGTGMAIFPVEFTCIVMRPFKNEIYEAVVTNVTRVSEWATGTSRAACCADILLAHSSAHNAGGDRRWAYTPRSARLWCSCPRSKCRNPCSMTSTGLPRSSLQRMRTMTRRSPPAPRCG